MATDDEPREKTIDELIEASSLGTPEAKAIRAKTPPEVGEEVMRRLDADDTGLPAGDTDEQRREAWAEEAVGMWGDPHLMVVAAMEGEAEYQLLAMEKVHAAVDRKVESLQNEAARHQEEVGRLRDELAERDEARALVADVRTAAGERIANRNNVIQRKMDEIERLSTRVTALTEALADLADAANALRSDPGGPPNCCYTGSVKWENLAYRERAARTLLAGPTGETP
jgi:hypothetical protein